VGLLYLLYTSRDGILECIELGGNILLFIHWIHSTQREMYLVVYSPRSPVKSLGRGRGHAAQVEMSFDSHLRL
jgi:hypothetical protein